MKFVMRSAPAAAATGFTLPTLGTAPWDYYWAAAGNQSTDTPTEAIATINGVLNSKDLTSPTAAKRPTLQNGSGANSGELVYRYDGVDDWSRITGETDLTQPFTIVLAFQLVTQGGGDNVMVDSSDAVEAEIYEELSATKRIRAWAGGTETQMAASDTDPHVVSVVFNGASSTAFYDQVDQTIGNPGANNIRPVGVGAAGNETLHANFDMKGLFIYPAALSRADQTTLENEILDFWTI